MSEPWWKKSVVYQVYPQSFKDSNNDGVGDIRGIIEKLPYIKRLGADVIWLNPIYESPNVDNGYDISDYRAIQKRYGTMEDFEELLGKAHELGIRIIMDLVVNHTSDQHKWFKESCKAEKNKYRDYYIWKEGKDGHEPNNWGSSFGGSTWEYKDSVGKYYLHLFAKEQPDLNWENEEVRNEVYDVMRFWLDKGIDGFRMDVINLISKRQEFKDGTKIRDNSFASYYEGAANGPRVHEFLHEMNEKVLSKYNLITVGETPNTTTEDAIKYSAASREELNMVFQFEHMHVDYDENRKWNTMRPKLSDLKKVLSKWQERLAEEGWNSLYWNNHDQARVVSRFGDDGKYRIESAKMLGTLLHMMQGTPYVYQGEELAMTNVHFDSIEDYKDIEILNRYHELVDLKGKDPSYALSVIHAKGRDNARTPMQWDNSENAGFSHSEPWIKVNPNYVDINAQKQIDDENSVFNYYRKLIQLRKDYDIITSGRYELILKDDSDIFAYLRKGENETLLTICNFTNRETIFRLSENIKYNSYELLIGNYKNNNGIDADIKLKPYEARVYLLK